MNIYIAHASTIDFQEHLYKPLRESDLNNHHSIVLPHEESEEQFPSKQYLGDTADLMIAEVTDASTGMGIELGWANSDDVPIIAIHKEGTTPTGAIKAVTDTIIAYSNSEDLIAKLTNELQNT